MINKETKEWAPVPRFLDAQQLTKDVTAITDAARGKTFSNFMMGMALLKNYHAFQGPKGLKLWDLFKKFDKTWALTKRSTTKYGRTSPDRTVEDAMKRRQTDPWNFLFIAACGSRIFSITTSAAPKCASFRTPRSRAKSPSAPTTRA